MLALILLAATICAAIDDPLLAGFVDPPNAAKPRVWWHWMNGNVTKAGITADLEAMAKAGIGGAHLFDVGCDVPPGDVAFGTPAWDEHVRHAISEAARLGLELTLANCSGFANAGGPWIAPSNSMFFVACSETRVRGGTRPDAPLARSAKDDHGFYRDIAVLAFPQPPCERDVPEDLRVESPATNVFVFSASRPFALRGVRLAMDLRDAQVWTRHLDLAIETSDDGRTWRRAGAASTLVVNEGKSDCDAANGDEKLLAFPRPVAARRIRLSGDLSRHYCFWGKREGRIARLEPDFRRALPQLNERTFRSNAALEPFTDDSLPGEAVDPKDVVDLTDRLAADGALDWTAPAGADWIVLRIGYHASGVRCHPSSALGGGLEVDKLDADAVRRHLERYALAYAGTKGVAAILCDSYEVGSQNWTHGFERQFARLNGYSLLPYLAAFSGRVVGSAQATERALRDYRRTLSALFCENFAGTFAKACAERGLVAAMEPYGNGPFGETDYAWRVPQPMAEFWVEEGDGADAYSPRGRDQCRLVHRVASSAHLRGIPTVDAESFTSWPDDSGRWMKDPFGLKAYGDLLYTHGLTRVVYHRWAQQPWTSPARLPGMTMGQWGTHFERTETWWPFVGPWLKYQARCQFLLQQGSFAADLLVYGGDDVPNAPIDEAALPEGVAWDLCGKDALAELTVTTNGALKCRAATEYAALALPTNVWISPVTEKRLVELKSQGAKIVRNAKDLKLDADFRVERRGEDAASTDAVAVRAIHRRYDNGREGYFVANPSTNAVVAHCSFRIAGKAPQFWDPETGAVSTPRVWREADSRTEVEIAFKPCGSLFVMFVPKGADAPPAEERLPDGERLALDGPWSLSFPPGWNCPATVRLPKLVSWTEIPDGEAKYFSGIAEYRYRGKLPAALQHQLKTPTANGGAARVILDLGVVKNLAEVTVNGRTFEPLWRPPFELDVTDALGGDGAFDLRVRVANLWPNRLIGDARKAEDCEWEGRALKEIPKHVREGKPSPTGRLTFTTWRHWSADEPLLPSGLLGPVTLRR